MKSPIRFHEPTFEFIRLTPDRSVENKEGPIFANSMHDLQLPFYKRFSRDSAITYRPPARFHFIISLSYRRADFYLSTEKGEHTAYLMQRMSRMWPKVKTSEEAPLPIPLDNSEVSDMKYMRHNIFALSVDNRKDTVPIHDILTVLRDMKPGDRCMIAMTFEPYARTAWSDRSDKAHALFKQGKTPKRSALSSQLQAKEAINLLLESLDEMKETLTSGLDGKEDAKKRDRERRKMSQRKRGDMEKREIIEKGRLDPATVRKQNQPCFKTWIRVIAHSESVPQRRILLRTLSNSFTALAGNNEFVAKKTSKSAITETNELSLNQKTLREPDVNIMSAEEVGRLIQLPTAGVQDEFKEFMDLVEFDQLSEIPSCFLDDKGIYVGTSEIKGKMFDIHVPTDNLDMLMSSRGFIGSPRQGKDQALINLIVESKRKHGIGAIIPDWIDEHGVDDKGNQRGLSDGIRNSLPPEDIIDLTLTNPEWAVYFGVQSLVQESMSDRLASDLVSKEITNFLMGDESDLHQTREYLRDAAKVCKGDLLDIKKLFTDPVFRKQKIAEMESTRIGDVDMWDVFGEDLSDAQRANIFAPINVRMSEILNDEMLKPIFCQIPNPAVNIERWIREGKVIILRMKMDEMAVKILAHFVVMIAYLIKKKIDGKDAPTWLVLNEPHQVQTASFVHFVKKILVEGPKYRLAPVLAFHHLGAGHLSKEFVDTLCSANLSWHCFFNSNVQTYERLRPYIEPTFTPDTAMKQTARFHFIAAGWRDAKGVTQPPFMVHAPAPVKDRWGAKDLERLTQQHLEKYGRPIIEVLDEIRDRTRIVRQKSNQQYGDGTTETTDSKHHKTKKQPPKHVFMKS